MCKRLARYLKGDTLETLEISWIHPGMVSPGCLQDVSRVFPECFQQFPAVFQGVCTEIHDLFPEAERARNACFVSGGVIVYFNYFLEIMHTISF